MTRLTARLSIEVPVVQSGMRGVAGPDLAAAVSNAGGLGILAALMVAPDALHEQIAAVRRRTDRPFGVNVWLHDELRPPPTPDSLAKDHVERVQEVLNGLRARLGLAPPSGLPAPVPDLLDDALDVLVDERIPVFSAGVGLPTAELVERFHEVGTVVMAMVTTVEDAVEAVARGVDVVVAQGAEAGGHRSIGAKGPRAAAQGTGSMVLIPAVRDAVGSDVVVVAAGGIADGRGLAAAMVLGADGVLLGTRFVATAESLAHPEWKQAILAGVRPTVVTDAISGQWARTLQNDFVTHVDAAGVEPLPGLLHLNAAGDIFAAARSRSEVELMPLYAGDSARLIHDAPSAAEVVRQITVEAVAASALASGPGGAEAQPSADGEPRKGGAGSGGDHQEQHGR